MSELTPEQRVLALMDEWDEQYEPDFSQPYTCARCAGEGSIMVCVDDICRGGGFEGGGCFHGDGYQPCPECKGAGEIYP